MNFDLLLLVLGVWVLLVVCAIVNGVFRQMVLLKRLGEKIARAVSAVTLSLIILTLTYILLACIAADYSDADLWIIGLLWLGLTMSFEFGFGHFFMHKSWGSLLEDYNIIKGKLWIVVLIVTVSAPSLVGYLI